MKRIKFNDEKEDVAIVQNIDEIFELSDYIGFESKFSNRFMVCLEEPGSYIYVRPIDAFRNIEDGNYFIFDTERELYEWILGEGNDKDHVN